MSYDEFIKKYRSGKDNTDAKKSEDQKEENSESYESFIQKYRNPNEDKASEVKEPQKTNGYGEESYKSFVQKYRNSDGNNGSEPGGDINSRLERFDANYRSYWDSAVKNLDSVGYANANSLWEENSKSSKALREEADGILWSLYGNEDAYDPEAYKAAVDSLTQVGYDLDKIGEEFSNYRRYYGQWDTEEDYNAYLEAEKLRQQMMGEDLGLLEKEIQDLEKQRDSFEYDWTDNRQREAAEAHSEEYNKQISAKRQYYNKAKLLQEGAAMSDVVNNDDFREYSGYASTESGKWYDFITTEKGMGYNDLTYEYINNQNGIREEIDRRFTAQDGATIGGADSKFEYRSLSHMTAEEVAIYNYHYAKKGREAAERYLDTIQEDLNARKAYKTSEELKGQTASQILYGYTAGWDQFDSGLKSLFNTDSDYIPTSYVQLASGMVREDLGQTGPKLPQWLGGASLGQMGYDAVNTTSHMLPSIFASSVSNVLVPGSGAYVGNALTFASSAGNSYQEALNMGYSKEQARSYSTLVGASEAGLQYFLGGISKLGGKVSGSAISKMMSGIDSALGKAALQLTGSMLSEGMEEGLQEIMTTWFKNLTLHAGEDINWEEVAYSSLMGMLTSGIMEIGGSAVNKVVSSPGKAQDKQSPEGSAPVRDDVQQRENTPEPEAPVSLYDDAPAVQETAAEDPLWALAQEVAADQREAENARQEDLDGAETAADAREDIGGVWEQTQSEEAYGAVENAPTVQGQQAAEAASDPVWEAAHTVARETRQQQEAPAEEQLTDAQPETVQQTKAAEKERLIYGKYTGIREIQRGKVLLDVFNGDVNDSSKMDPNWHEELNACKLLSRIRDHIDIDTGNQLLGKLAEHRYAVEGASVRGMEQAYNYGYAGYDRSAMEGKNTMAALVPEDVRNILYDMGAQYRQKVEAEKAKSKTTPEPKTDQNVKPAEADSGKHRGPDESRYEKVRFEGDITRWGKKQQAEVEFVEFVAKNFSGNRVYVYESYKNADGKYVYTDSAGRVQKAHNGVYVEKNGDIYLDLNAGDHSEGLVLNTFAHELYHHIEMQAPEQAKALAEFIAKELGEDNVEAAVNRQIKKARKAGYGEGFFEEQGMSAEEARQKVRDRAYSDFIADGLETMFTKGDVVHKLADLHRQDKGLSHTIRKFIRKWVSKLREFYNAGNTLSIEGRLVAELETFDEIQQMFAKALKIAGENYRAQKNTAGGGGVDLLSLNDNSLTPGAEGAVVNQNGDPVAYATSDGTVMLSLRTYEEEGRDTFRKYLQKCVTSNKLTKAEMQEMLDGIEEIYGVCKEFKDKFAPFSAWSDASVVRDTHGRPVFSVVTPNGDYKMNLDFSLVCKKRRTLDAVFNEMSRRGIIDDFELGQKSVVKINEIIRKYGLETACALCFVDAKRFRQASMADSFTRLYNELVESLVPEEQKGSIGHFNFGGYSTVKKVEGGIDTWDNSKLDFSHLDYVMKHYGKGTVEHKAARYIKSHAEGRKLLLRGDFMSSQGFDAVKTQNKDILKLYNSKKGTGGPKAAFGDVQYMNEIIRKARTWTPAKAYAVGGVRIQSFSDYVPRMVFDYVQMVYDLAATKLPAHAYTKEALFVKQFGLTGIKINMSLIPAIAEGGIAPGLDANGDYVWAGESFDYETAKQIQNAEGYTENCGTICVGVSYEHIKKLLNDPNIRMVIPYHKSGLNPIVAHMNKIAEFTDYTNDQRTKGKDGKVLSKDFDFSKAMHDMGENASPKAVADQYLKWCVANGYTARFAEFAAEENYYKLLEDFTLYDKDGNYVPQREVRAVFPKETDAFGSMKDLIHEGLEEDAIVEGKRDKNLSAIVDEIQKTLPRTEAEISEEQVEQADRALFSERDTESVSNRSLLANALDSVAQDESEKRLLEEYREAIGKLEGYEKHLAELKEQIRELSFGKGPRDMAKIRALKDEAIKTSNRIGIYDKKLLRLEGTKTLERLLNRETERVRQLEKQRGLDAKKKAVAEARAAGEQKLKDVRAAQKRNVESRHKTQARHEIQKTAGELKKLFARGKDARNVKQEMRDMVAKSMELAEKLFGPGTSDMLRDGVGVAMTADAAQRFREGQELLEQLDVMSTKDPKRPEMMARLRAIKSDLADVFAAEQNRINNTAVPELMDGLCNAYQELQYSDKDYIRAAYDPDTLTKLQTIKDNLGAVRAVDMDLKQLQELSKAYRMVLGTIRAANKCFASGKTVEETARQVVRELNRKDVGKVRKALRDWMDARGWDYEKPFYALDRIGSQTLKRLYRGLMDAENVTHRDVMEAKAEQMKLVEKYGYNTWKVDRKMPQEFVDNTGKTFRMTLGEVMSLYAYSRRDAAQKHIEVGGFTLKQKSGDAVTYKLTHEQCQGITELLTKEQKAFVEEMQTFLSQNMGAKGNEVSMKLYGVELFGEENYFPIHTDKRFMATAQEAKAKEEAGFGSLSNAGFTKATNKNAVAPMAIEPFMTVWADHVNEMSRYHGAVPALEDIRRVMNYSRYNDAEADSVSVKAALENAYGKKAVEYLDALYREANSGAVTDRLDMENTSRKMLSRFRKNAVAYSASVVIQQPASLCRAFAMIDKKYFGGVRGMGTLIGGVAKTVSNPLTKVQNKAYAEMLKYAPGVTLAKEIGGFDTTGGSSIRSYLLDTERGFRDTLRAGTGKEKAGLLLGWVDDNPIANLPNVADKLAWIEIWNACKRETLAKNTDLVPGSEAALEKAGERFTEVIRATQVYDSMFAKSPMLKSKSLAMQYVVSFMNEPNTTANLVESALRDARKGQWGQATKKVTAVVRSTIFTCVLKSLIYAMRDEDEDETYIEKYVASLTGNLLSDVNVFNYFPITKDVWGLLQGFEVERPDTAVLGDAINALMNVCTNTFKDVSDLSEEELAEWDKKCIQANWKLVDSVAAFFGIPVKNIRREINSWMDHAAIAAKNQGMTSWIGVEQAVRQGIADASPSFVNQDLGSKTDRLYQAVMAGDEAYEARLRDSYKDDDAYNAALRKALRDNDPRIRQAAEARMTGDFATYKKLLHEVKDEGKFSFDRIMEAINGEETALKRKNREEGTQEKATEPEYEGIFDEEDYFLAVKNGDIASQKMIYDALVAEKEFEGYITHEAESQIASALVTRIGKAYMSEEISAAQALAMLEDHTEKGESQIKIWDFELEHNFPWSARVRKYRRGDLSEQDLIDAVMDIEGATAQEAREYIQFLDLEKQYPDIDITAANAAKYFEDAKPRGISVERFMDYVHVEHKYLAGEISASAAQKLIMEVGELDEEDARCQVLVYDWKNEGYEGVTLAAVREYEEYCAASQVPRDAYLRIRKIKNNTENDVDENGKTVRYSAVKKVMEQIGKLNISDAQKEAIAKSMGWADSTIRKYKTW